jgi:hypothetical protein
MKKLVLLLAVLLPLAVSAQDKYCATYQDFLADVWQTVGADAQLQLLPSAKEDSLALELKAKGADRKLRHMLKRCFALEYGGQLYLNLRGSTASATSLCVPGAWGPTSWCLHALS